MDEQLHIFENWFGICVAILGYFAEYFQDDFRILIMADSEIEKLLSLLCNHCELFRPFEKD